MGKKIVKSDLLPVSIPPLPDLADIYGKAREGSGWSTGEKMVREVVAVPTTFYDFNYCSMVGGLPVERIHLVTGPTSNGKTAFVLGLVKSFLDRGLLAGYIDAEKTLEKTFVTSLFARPLKDYPNFWLPDSQVFYEDAISTADMFFARSKDLAARFPWFRGSILVVDTINKLAPRNELDSILGEMTSKKADKTAENLSKGHQGRDRARLNQGWIDRLTAQAAEAHCAVVLIAQERVKGQDDYGNDLVEVKGGAALKYDSSLVMRVTKPGGKAGLVYRSSAPAKDEKPVGSIHNVTISKSKVGTLEMGNFTRCRFYLSSGFGDVPKGIDRWRDLLETATAWGVLTLDGNTYSFRDRKIAVHKNPTIKALHDDESLFREVEEALIAAEVASRPDRRHDMTMVDETTGEVIPV